MKNTSTKKVLHIWLLVSGLMFTVIAQSFAQQFTVKGKITNEINEALPSVNVVVKNTTRGALTDAQGEFDIENVSGNDVLVITFIGYTTEEVTVGNRDIITVAKTPDIE